MEGVSTWCQVDVLRLTSFGCPAFNCISFSFLAFVDFNLSSGDFFSTEVDLTESHLARKIIILIGNSQSSTIGRNSVSFTLSVFLSDIGHFHCTIMLDLECDISHFEVTRWGGFLMEGISARC